MTGLTDEPRRRLLGTILCTRVSGVRCHGLRSRRWRRLGFALVASVALAVSTAAAGPAAPETARVPGPPVPKAGPAALEAWISARIDLLTGLLKGSGLDVGALIERAERDFSGGQGGPLVPALGTAADGPGEAQSLADVLDRLQRVDRLFEAVPLAEPMETYRLTSRFGYRRDPFTRRAALHEGQDFGGPRNAPVLATAPGKVVAAKRAGAYGIMVEIDHGMGIRTRYAHLKRALVRQGQRVATGQKVGVMGSTGRSTGAHLHYEVRVDGRALDPARFLAAGQRLRKMAGG